MRSTAALLLGASSGSEWTPRAVQRSKLWVMRHSHTFAVRGLSVLGVLLIIKGIVGLA